MFTITSLLALFGLSSAFAAVALVFAAWMAWRIVAKAGLPGWLGLIAVLLTLTGIGAIVPLVALWIFAFMGWPRDAGSPVVASAGNASAASVAALPAPMAALPERRTWRLSGAVASGSISLAVDGSEPSYRLTGAPAAGPGDLTVPDPSVGAPHARLLIAGSRLGLEDLRSATGTFIDGARLLPEHGPRDISQARTIRLGTVDLALSRA